MDRVMNYPGLTPEATQRKRERSRVQQLSKRQRWRLENPEAHTEKVRLWRAARIARLAEIAKNKRKDGETKRSLRRRSHLKKKFGVTPEFVAQLLAAQDGVCAVCASETSSGKRTWHVDHDHVTGKVRGILCVNCNAGLGLFKDDPRRLRGAIQYLLDPPASSPEKRRVG